MRGVLLSYLLFFTTCGIRYTILIGVILLLTIQNEPKREAYNALIDFAFDICEEFQLVVRTDILQYKDSFLDLNDWFGDAFVEVHEQHEWPSTNLFDDTAKVYYFKTTDEAKRVLKEKAESMFEWIHPELPEDLCFFKDGEAWLSSSSELKELYVYPTSVNEIHALKNIDGLKVLDIQF